MRHVATALLIAMLAAACSAPSSAPASSAVDTSPGPGATPEVGEQQQHEAGSVKVSAAWVAGTASAEIGMNTHSIDLDGFDLTELARVRLDGGAWIAPTQWDSPLGGHHRGGRLTFGMIEPRMLATAGTIELEIHDVGVPSHMLRWERSR